MSWKARFIERTNRKTLWMICDESGFPVCYLDPNFVEDAEEKARILAAANTLFEALQNLCFVVKPGESPLVDKALDAGFAAVAYARGKNTERA